MEAPQGPYCQSCGMPLSMDQGGGGTEADGTKTQKYCSHCYQNGSFTQPNLSVDQMMDAVKGMMMDQRGLNEEDADRMAAGIPQLARWSQS